MGLITKLGALQYEVQAPKDQYNEFGKYKYRSVESILAATKPKLLEYGLVLMLTDELVQIGERYYVKATAKLIDTETSESMETYGWAREEETKKGMDSSQITGASSSYARKYALNGLLALDDVKDSDATNTQTKEDEPAAVKEAETQPAAPTTKRRRTT